MATPEASHQLLNGRREVTMTTAAGLGGLRELRGKTAAYKGQGDAESENSNTDSSTIA